MVKIEEGKYYLTRDGRKVGPMEHGPGERYCWIEPGDPAIDGSPGGWMEGGSFYCYASASGLDIVAEWTDGVSVSSDGSASVSGFMAAAAGTVTSPVRTVTRKEVVGGEYGPILVETDGAYVRLGFKTTGGIFPPTRSIFSTSELRQVASVLTQIADALDENEKETK